MVERSRSTLRRHISGVLPMTEEMLKGVSELLGRLSDCGTGRTVVANIARTIASETHRVPTVSRILSIWMDRAKAYVDAKNLELGQLNPPSTMTLATMDPTLLFRITAGRPKGEADLIWEELRAATAEDFPETKHWTCPSHVKLYSDVVTHVLKESPLDPHTSVKVNLPITEHVDLRVLKTALDKCAFIDRARIHYKKWFWITEGSSVTHFLRSSNDNASLLTDGLGLVHMSQRLGSKNAEQRLVVEMKLADHYVATSVKPIFAFADSNPRFVTWTEDPHSTPTCGYAANLAAFDRDMRLEAGLPERVAFTPASLEQDDVISIQPHGFLKTDRWGTDPYEPHRTNDFADALSNGRTSRDLVALVIDHIK
jgi:hypothetical protein